MQEQIDAMFNDQFKTFFEADNAGAVFQLQDGYELDNFSNTSKGNKLDSRDIKSLVDDIIDFVSMAFHVPKGMLKGDVVDVSKQTDNFLMFCINPLIELITDEINRKFYTKEEYLSRTYLKVDTSRIKYVDITELANACDVFFRIGVNSINDILRMLGREPIDEEWADMRYVTKNYESVENAESLKGGEKMTVMEIPKIKIDLKYLIVQTQKKQTFICMEVFQRILGMMVSQVVKYENN